MTTTLRPTEPLQHAADGALSRHYHVCVNSRPVGALHLATHPDFGPAVAVVGELRIEEPERRRGRGTVAALAAEEVARGWGCERIETSVEGEAAATEPGTGGGTGPALHLASALGYVERNRQMHKHIGDQGEAGSGRDGGGTAAPLPEGSLGRPMTDAEYQHWFAAEHERYARTWIARGVPETEAYAKSDHDHARHLPDGAATADARLRVLEHRGGVVGTLWVTIEETRAYVLDVEVGEEHRGQGHGRVLMRLAENEARAAGRAGIGLNVFAGNTPALRLYESLGYRPTAHHLYKQL